MDSRPFGISVWALNHCVMLYNTVLSTFLQQLWSTSTFFAYIMSIPFLTPFPPVMKIFSSCSRPVLSYALDLISSDFFSELLLPVIQFLKILFSLLITLPLFTYKLAQASKKIPPMGPSIHLSSPHSIITFFHSSF